MIPPLKRDRTNADKNDDKDWAIIPISFGPSKERWSGSGIKCLHIDAHVNTCVADMFKRSVQKIGSITNYILQKFQHVVQNHYILHTKSVKALKNKKYKAWRGANTEIADYVLPEAFHVDHYEKVLKKMEDMARRLNPEGAKRMDQEKNKLKKEDVKMPTSNLMEKMEEQENKEESKIRIPGINDNKENVKRPIIMEVGGSDKYMPNFTVKHLDETNQVQFIF